MTAAAANCLSNSPIRMQQQLQHGSTCSQAGGCTSSLNRNMAASTDSCSHALFPPTTAQALMMTAMKPSLQSGLAEHLAGPAWELLTSRLRTSRAMSQPDCSTSCTFHVSIMFIQLSCRRLSAVPTLQELDAAFSAEVACRLQRQADTAGAAATR